MYTSSNKARDIQNFYDRLDSKIKEFYEIHKRPEEFKELNPGDVAYYDGMIYVDLSK